MNILDQIIEYKKKEVAGRKSAITLGQLESSHYFGKKTQSLVGSLKKGERTGIISEFKRRSPSKGVINNRSDIVAVTNAYTTYGASALSILTDENFFGGSNADLLAARVNDVPILRKEFIIDEYQLIESKSIGADVVLLIAACLTQGEVKQLAKMARNLDLEVLLELHSEEEIDHICDDTDLIGINNRNLKTFAVDIDHSLRMAEKIPAGRMKIAESGIRSVDDILLFRENGFDGFLVGELFMKEEDPAIAFAEFVNALQLTPPHAEGF